ncbi:MAG TPA: transposase [Candidatus Baltobacteraceae bacterium]|nr:transposase [Candidatus Baltobacteraceae bacterium]
MRKSRFTEAQIVSILKEHDAGASFIELGRRHGVHPNTISAWNAKYGGMESSEVARSRAVLRLYRARSEHGSADQGGL